MSRWRRLRQEMAAEARKGRTLGHEQADCTICKIPFTLSVAQEEMRAYILGGGIDAGGETVLYPLLCLDCQTKGAVAGRETPSARSQELSGPHTP